MVSVVVLVLLLGFLVVVNDVPVQGVVVASWGLVVLVWVVVGFLLLLVLC